MPHYDSLTRPFRLPRTAAASLIGLTLAISCQNPSILSPLPGSQWQLSDTTLSAMSFNQIEVPAFSNSSVTLYAGPIGGDPANESVVLLKPTLALFDTLEIDSTFISAYLVIFRKVFRDSTPDLSSLFELSIIVADSIIWSEADTSLTADSPGFGLLTGALEASMTSGNITVPSGDSTITITDIEHLKFPILAETLNDWLADTTVRNGFMLRQIGGSDAVGFRSRFTTRPPIIAVTFADTTGGGETRTVYAGMATNLGIYPPSQQPMPADTTLMVFSFYDGWGAHLDFGPSLIPDSTRHIIAAKLNFYSPQFPDELTSSMVTLRFDRVIDDSLNTAVLFAGVTYASDKPEWKIVIGELAQQINSGWFKNFGIDIRVVPVNHDFDTLIFHSPYADPALRPTLELVYAIPYGESP